MGPQCEDGYTRIANELLDALCRIRIPGESMQIFCVILRKTYGYGKKIDRISLSQFVEATGMKKPNVCRALKQLQTLNVIHIDKIVIQNDNGFIQNDNANYVTYRINKFHASWESGKRVQSRPASIAKTVKPFIQSDNETLSKTIINVIQNDTHNRKKETKEKNLTPFAEILDFLNLKAGKSFKLVDTHKRHIQARWNEGYSLEDFKTVISAKSEEWGDDEKMSKYLRPETLFGGKFDSYLQSAGTYAGKKSNADGRGYGSDSPFYGAI